MKKILSLFALLALFLIGGANKAVADYYVGEQIGLSELQDGDLVIFEAAASSGSYGKYLTDGTVTNGRALTHRSAIRLYTGLTDAAVWRLVSTGAIGKYYLQSVASGYYYAKSLGQMTDDINSADVITAYQFPDGFPAGTETQRYDDWSGNPVGYNLKSIALHTGNYSNYWLCSSGNDMVYGDQHHTHYWNMFKVSTDASEGTAFSAYDGTTSTISDVTIDGLVYNLTSINSPSGNVAQLNKSNKNNSSTSVNIPAYVTYEGKTYHVNGFLGSAFEGGTFSTLTFDSPNTFFIPDWAFANCDNVTEVEVPEGVSILVQNRAFGYMDNLETITLPSTLKTIENYTFSEDPKLTTIIFNGVTPPTFKGTNLFENTNTDNITLVVPSAAAIDAYTQAIATYNSTYSKSITFKEIVADPNANGKLITDLSQISDDKYYFIISQFDGFRSLGNGANAQNYDGKEAALGYSTKSGVSGSLENVVSWVVQKRSEPDVNVIWKIIKTGDNYELQNIGSGKYVGSVVENNRLGWTNTFEVAQQISPDTDGSFTICNAAPASITTTWRIQGGFHNNTADFISATTGANGYGSTSGSEKAWKIYELSDVQVQALSEDMIEQLTLATEGVGYVNGCKDEASRTAIISLLVGSPSYTELRDAYDNNIIHLTDGYYRLSYPKNYQGILGEPFVFFDNAKLLFSNLSVEAAKADYSTVYKVTVEGGVTRPAGSGYTVVMESQGVRPYYNGGYGDQKAVDANTAKAWLIRPTGGFDDGSHTGFAIEVSQASGSFHGNYYLCKTKDAANNPIAAYYAGGSATKLATSAQGYLYPATDITITMHEAEGNYWATLYVPFGVTLPEGTAAYVGNVDTDGRLKLTSLGQNIPAGTPVIVCGDAASVTATINDEIPAYEGTNGLKGQYLAHDAASDNVLTLGKKDGKVGFYTISNALGANKAYLAASTGAKGFQFVFDDDDITGINDAQTSNLKPQTYFDLQGRKVAAPQKGSLYIKGGKVVKF